MRTSLSSTATDYMRTNKCDEYSIIKIKEKSVNTWDGGFLMIIFALEVVSNDKIKIGEPVEYSADHISSSKNLLQLDLSYKNTLKFTQGKMNQLIERFPRMVPHQEVIHNLIDECKHPVDLIPVGHYQKPSSSDTVVTTGEELNNVKEEIMIVQALNKKRACHCKNSQDNVFYLKREMFKERKHNYLSKLRQEPSIQHITIDDSSLVKNDPSCKTFSILFDSPTNVVDSIFVFWI